MVARLRGYLWAWSAFGWLWGMNGYFILMCIGLCWTLWLLFDWYSLCKHTPISGAAIFKWVAPKNGDDYIGKCQSWWYWLIGSTGKCFDLDQHYLKSVGCSCRLQLWFLSLIDINAYLVDSEHSCSVSVSVLAPVRQGLGQRRKMPGRKYTWNAFYQPVRALERTLTHVR